LRPKLIRSIVFAITTVIAGTAVCSAATIVPKRLYGNVGYFYTGNKADGGATTNSSLTTFSLNLDSYFWRPWFATLDMGATSSMSSSETATTSSRLDLVSTRLNFALMSRSRYPFRLSYNTSDNVTDWTSGKITLISLGPQYKTRFLNARQSLITKAGNRFDAWFTQRTRNYTGIKLVDDTFGAKLKTRGKTFNLYANGVFQKRTNSLNNDETENRTATMTHNFFPNKAFYIKTQFSSSHNDVGSEILNKSNVGMFRNRLTRTNQLSSFMYWRPDYKPYTATGGLRVYRRYTDDGTDTQDNVQQGVSANLAGNYKINRRLRATATVTNSGLYSSGSNDYVTISSNQSVLVNYRSDNVIYREYLYNWFASGGVTSRVGFKNPEDESVTSFQPGNRHLYSKDYSQNVRGGAGHTLTRSWLTGNRSTLKVNLNQSANETLETKGKRNSLGISHSASINWHELLKKGKFYSQLTMLDSRNIDESTESQLVNLQVSRIVPINRLSQWGSHLSTQSSRRYTSANEEDSFWDGFLTSVNGRLNYQHARMFGIYKLKFRTRVEFSSTANRRGGDRKQADWEGRLGYNIGKLSTALIGRKVWSDSGIGTGIVVFQVNRSF